MFYLCNINELYIFANFSLKINFLFILGFVLFMVGLFSVIFIIERVIVFLMCIELMWLGVGLSFLGAFLFLKDSIVLVYTIVVLGIAASETALGLSILVNFYRINKSISLRNLNKLRG
jgi:NADH-quinone oxidoreductase subunit K